MNKYLYISAEQINGVVLIDDFDRDTLTTCQCNVETGSGALFKITAKSPITIAEWEPPHVDHEWREKS